MKQTLILTTRQTQCLTDITRASTSAQRLVQRASIILGSARSGNQSAVAREVGVAPLHGALLALSLALSAGRS
jgi:hypothetical protein